MNDVLQPAPFRIYLVGADPLALAGLDALLQNESDLEILGQGEQLKEASTHFPEPHVIVWDPGWDFSLEIEDAAEDLAAGLREGPPILILLSHEEDSDFLWSQGVAGLLLRSVRPAVLAAALRALAAGLRVQDSRLAAPPSESLLQQTPLLEPLSPREIEVLNLLAEGLTNRSIGLRLAISEHTVKFHVSSLMGKLDAGSRTEAVARASRAGLLRL